jgi:hypothetical protein
MTSFPALDVALGVSFVFLVLSVVATAATESVARIFKWRARTLEHWLQDGLSTSDGESGAKVLDAFYASPLMQVLALSSKKPERDEPAKAAKKTGRRAPSYIPSAHFVSSVLSVGRTAVADAEKVKHAEVSVDDALAKSPLAETAVGTAMLELLHVVDGNVERFRREAEGWFDDQMERLSGVYKRWTQAVSLAVGVGLVAVLDADAFRIAETLWHDPAARAVVVAQAGNSSSDVAVNDALGQVNSLPLPLGWGGSHPYDSLWAALFGIVGGIVTVLAIQLGAPFWFDTLSRIARIRSTGTPPTVAGGIRRGDGDQARVNVTTEEAPAPPPP